jgi:ribonuclease BN (tRNA processing enzyme)
MQSLPKLIFLGTGGDSVVVGKQIASAGGFILQAEDNQFHVDPGPGALAKAAGYGANLRSNVAVMVSHNHLNHASDINAVISAMTLGGLDKKGVLIAARSAYEDNPQAGMTTYLNPYFKNHLEKDIVIEPGKKIGINEIEVHATRTRHSDEFNVGFKFYTPKFSLGYTSDTAYSTDLAEDFKGMDVMVLNCLNPSDKKTTGHLNTDDCALLLAEIKPKVAIITHFGIKMIDADPMNEARNLQRKTGVHIVSAKDGFSFNPVSYTVNQKQFNPFSGVKI